MAHKDRDWLTIPAAAALLLWPAVWNRYPIVFADTGTYLTQAIHRYAGWDRPVFYSLFIFPLHAMRSLWPIVIVQALLTAWVLRLITRRCRPALSAPHFLAAIALLALGTWLPWMVSEVMPDLFTPLLVLVLALLAGPDEAQTGFEAPALIGLATLMIATQQSSLPLSVALGLTLILLRRRLAANPASSHGPRPRSIAVPPVVLRLALPPLLAVIALCGVNLAAHDQFSVSPFGSVFLLARMLADGPAAAVLRQDCPAAGWRLCAYRFALPADSDVFLWDADSPLYRAGGPKRLAGEAEEILRATLLTEPSASAVAALRNSLRQAEQFASGDGLNAWPHQVGRHIAQDFPPAEAHRYAAARQQAGHLTVPPALALLHRIVALAGLAGAVLLLPSAWRRRRFGGVLLPTAVLTLGLSAAITGALSGPHDRYQARVMWLPVFAAIVGLADRQRGRPA